MADDLKKTPLYAEHVKLGGRLVPFAGFELPVQYSGIPAEHRAVRATAGLFDVSHMGEFAIRGVSPSDAADADNFWEVASATHARKCVKCSASPFSCMTIPWPGTR